MIQQIEQTKEEKIAMYMKCSKREIIEMLLANQDILKSLTNTEVLFYDRVLQEKLNNNEDKNQS